MSERTIIKGSKALAERLNVCQKTVWEWRKEGILAPPTIAEYRRTILYDLDKVFECLQHRPVKSGRPSNKTTK